MRETFRRSWLCQLLFALFCLLYCLNAVTDTQQSFHESTACTPKVVTVRDAYLALGGVSGRWETMALLLDIDRGRVSNIEMDCHRDNDCKYRRTIQAWYNGRPDASWDELVAALVKMREHVIAKNIQTKYLCLKEPSTSQHDKDLRDTKLNTKEHLESELLSKTIPPKHAERVPSIETPDLDGETEAISKISMETVHDYHEHNTLPKNVAPSRPNTLPEIQGVESKDSLENCKQKDTCLENVFRNVIPVKHPQPIFDDIMSALKNEFEAMEDDLQEYLQSQNTQSFIWSMLKHMSSSLKKEFLTYRESEFTENVIEADNVSEVIDYFRAHMWNYLEYEIFQILVSKFGSKELQMRLEKYTVYLSKFQKATTLSEFFNHWLGKVDPPIGFARYSITINASLDEFTLEEAEHFRQKQAIRYSLPTYAFQIASGSKENGYYSIVTWFVWSAVGPQIIRYESNTNNPPHGMKNMSLMLLTIGDYVLFDSERQPLATIELVISVLTFFPVVVVVLFIACLWIKEAYTKLKEGYSDIQYCDSYLPFISRAVGILFVLLAGIAVGVKVDLLNAATGAIVGTYMGTITEVVLLVLACYEHNLNTESLRESDNYCNLATGGLTIGVLVGILGGSSFGGGEIEMAALKIGGTTGATLGAIVGLFALLIVAAVEALVVVCNCGKEEDSIICSTMLPIAITVTVAGALIGILGGLVAVVTVKALRNVWILAVMVRVVVLIGIGVGIVVASILVASAVEKMENSIGEKATLVAVLILGLLLVVGSMIGAITFNLSTIFLSFLSVIIIMLFWCTN